MKIEVLGCQEKAAQKEAGTAAGASSGGVCRTLTDRTEDPRTGRPQSTWGFHENRQEVENAQGV